MMKKTVVLVATLFAVSASFADDAAPTSPVRDTYYSSGYIVGLNLGQGEINTIDYSGYSAKNKGLFGRLFVGYDINHYFAFQFGYLYFPTATLSIIGSPDIKLQNTGFDGLLTGRFPLGEGFALYGNLGAALLNARQKQSGTADQTQNATVLACGGGLDYSFANIGGLHATLDYYHTAKKNTNTLNVPAQNALSFGIYYQF